MAVLLAAVSPSCVAVLARLDCAALLAIAAALLLACLAVRTAAVLLLACLAVLAAAVSLPVCLAVLLLPLASPVAACCSLVWGGVGKRVFLLLLLGHNGGLGLALRTIIIFLLIAFISYCL